MDDLFTPTPAPYMAESDTSRARAKSEDARGITAGRQLTALSLLREAGAAGLTWREMSEITGWHHGQTSGVLSTLHRQQTAYPRAGVIRDNCHPYVHVEYATTADLIRPARTRATRRVEALEAVANAARAYLTYRVQDTHTALETALKALEDLA